jgi:hypothetical protein
VTAIPKGAAFDQTPPPEPTCPEGTTFCKEVRMYPDGVYRYYGICLPVGTPVAQPLSVLVSMPVEPVPTEPEPTTTQQPPPTVTTAIVTTAQETTPTTTPTPAPTTDWWSDLINSPWLNQEIIAGVPNKYLLLGAAAFLLLFADGGRGKR